MPIVKNNISATRVGQKIDKAWGAGLAMLSVQILKDCNLYCKEDTGMLIASSLIHSQLEKGLLIWQTPYAARQYYEIKTAYKDVNPIASWRWCDVAKRRHASEWGRAAERIKEYYR